MNENKPVAIGLFVAALVLLGVMYWKYMLPHNPPARSPYSTMAQPPGPR